MKETTPLFSGTNGAKSQRSASVRFEAVWVRGTVCLCIMHTACVWLFLVRYICQEEQLRVLFVTPDVVVAPDPWYFLLFRSRFSLVNYDASWIWTYLNFVVRGFMAMW